MLRQLVSLPGIYKGSTSDYVLPALALGEKEKLEGRMDSWAVGRRW